MITKYQSPYKGFNRRRQNEKNNDRTGLNPPIRGSIDEKYNIKGVCKTSQSPYKGFNRVNMYSWQNPATRLNPPIRGSIEQDNALFKNYNHKRQICQGRSSPFYWGNRDIFVCVKNVFNSTLHSPHSKPVNNSSTAPLSRKANEHFNPPIRGSIAFTPLTMWIGETVSIPL